VNQDGLKLNSTHHLLFHADDVNMSCGRVHTIKNNTYALIVASKENGLVVNADRTKHMIAFRDHMFSSISIYNTKIGNTSFVWVKEFKYLGTNPKNQILLRKEL